MKTSKKRSRRSTSASDDHPSEKPPPPSKKRSRSRSNNEQQSLSPLPIEATTSTQTSKKNGPTTKIFRDIKTGRVYYESYHGIPIPIQDIYSPSILSNIMNSKHSSSNSSSTTTLLDVHMGDIITVQVEKDQTQSPPKKLRPPQEKRNKWFPFVIPWTTCQILAIYQNNQKSGKSTSSASSASSAKCHFLVRFFNRKTETSLKEIPKKEYSDNNDDHHHKITLSKNIPSTIEEVYETDIIGTIQIHSILGPATILPLLSSTTTSNSIIKNPTSFSLSSYTPTTTPTSFQQQQQQHNNDHSINIITITQYCKTFLLLNHKREYSIISQHSGKCHYHDELQDQIKRFISRTIQSNISSSTTTATTTTTNGTINESIDWFQFYRCCRGIQCLSLVPAVSASSASSSKTNTSTNARSTSIRKKYPFIDKFIPSALKVYLQRCKIKETQHQPQRKEEEKVEAAKDLHTNNDKDDNVSIDVQNKDDDDDDEMIVDDSLDKEEVFDDDDDNGNNNNGNHQDYTSPQKQKRHSSTTTATNKNNNTKKKNQSPTPYNDSSPTCIGKANELPYHVDIASLKAFYKHIEIDIPFDAYVEPYNNNHKRGNNGSSSSSTEDITKWNICIGDIVAVHCEEEVSTNNSKSCSTSTSNGRRGFSTIRDMFPFTVPWWPAEIVSIYKTIENHDDAKHLRNESLEEQGQRRRQRGRRKKKSLSLQDHNEGMFQIEIRWFYRKKDIPGVANLKSTIKLHNGNEEIFETDSIDEIEISSLLGRIELFSDPNDQHQKEKITMKFGMPVVNFFCHQLWSVHRKSLLPIGLASNRVQRGMMYSKYMGRDSATRVAFGDTLLVGSNSTTLAIQAEEHQHDWKKLFHETLTKLTLAESTSAGTDEEHNIIGRDSERKQIRQFLKSAIQGSNGTQKLDIMNSNMFVLFIGGAPGTGKTASVKSIIYQFNKDQAEGKLPSFQFVSVNGMEMRHPFDVYVRLWEAISNPKEICPAEEALAKLELHFGGNSNADSTDDKEDNTARDVVVVLVDEIDYLLTKKQTVLYNLFDWPSRGYSAKSPAQLIVIGISNTLNLPERLHGRLQSRIGRDRCMFSSYSIDESMDILKGKLDIKDKNHPSIFHPDAIKFAARKISAESGDIRKVFHLCKAAAENVYNMVVSGQRQLPVTSSQFGIIDISDIQTASRKMFNSSLSRGVADATSMEALFFVSLASLKRQLARERGGFDIKEVVQKMEGISSSFGDSNYLPAPSCSELVRMLNRLGEARIVSLYTPNGSHGSYGTSGIFSTRISLQLDAYEVLSALKDTRHKKLAEKFLSGSLFG